MSRVAPARSAAFQILLMLERGSGRSDEVRYQPAVAKLSPQDRNLTTTLVMGTLRWQIALDECINGLLKRPQMKLDPAVRIALRLGAFQLLYLDRVPGYAAIGESVELAKTAENRFAAGMVNAILRKIAIQLRPKEIITVTNGSNLAAAYAHPQWLVERWVTFFGLETAKRICEYDQQPAPVFIRLMGPDAERELLSEGIEVAPGSFLANARTVVRGDVSSTTAFREGRVRIQDEGSQLVAELAGHGQRILDACAAPGGKTAILAERNPEAAIVACDISPRRLSDMQRTLRDRPNIEFRQADIAKLKLEPEFDLVLCDAPCSGTGTLARNPEIRHRLRPEELQRQHERQLAILSSVMRGVKPGGRLLYSTCSLEPEENESVIRECLESRNDFDLIRANGEIDQLRQDGVLLPGSAKALCDVAPANEFFRTIPGVHSCDGFFAALLIRRSS